MHGFTHVYQVALLPLYFLILKDSAFGLKTVEQATFLVTVLMVAYFAPAYPVGILADRFSKKKLLTFGLALNGLGFVVLSYSHSYAQAILAMIVAGFGGSFFHPAATALIARLFPEGTGKALGFLGIGASAGFFLGPIYAGWRAAQAGWRAPVFELGFLGIIAAVAFFFLADEEPPHPHAVQTHNRLFPETSLLWILLAAAFAFSLRDFTGSSMGSLGSLFLQKAHGLDPRVTGGILSTIFLSSAISNPLFGRLSDRNQTFWTSLVLGIAAVIVLFFPFVPVKYSAVVLAVYGFFFMASYPMVEGALMNSIPSQVRGRVFGVFITVGGLLGNLAHWAAGAYVKQLGPHGREVSSYYGAYGVLALFVVLSLLGLPCLRAIRNRELASGQPVGRLSTQSSG